MNPNIRYLAQRRKDAKVKKDPVGCGEARTAPIRLVTQTVRFAGSPHPTGFLNDGDGVQVVDEPGATQ